MSDEVLRPGSPYVGLPGSGRLSGDQTDDDDTGPIPVVIEEGVALEPQRPVRTWRGKELRESGPVKLYRDPYVLPSRLVVAVFVAVIVLGSIGYLVLERL